MKAQALRARDDAVAETVPAAPIHHDVPESFDEALSADLGLLKLKKRIITSPKPESDETAAVGMREMVPGK